MLELLRSDPLLSSFVASVLVALAGKAVSLLHARTAPWTSAVATAAASSSKKALPKMMKIVWEIASRVLPIWWCAHNLQSLLVDPAPLTREDAFGITLFFWLLMFFVLDIAFPNLFRKPARGQ